jgi:DNA-binding HxlR family transcriptional regulator
MRKETSTNYENEQMILESCAMAYTLSLIGGRWKPVILWQIMTAPKRYKQLKEAIPNISERMLTGALRELEKDGLVSRITHPSFPPQVEYELTSLGRSMEPFLQSMSDWGKSNKPDRQF